MLHRAPLGQGEALHGAEDPGLEPGVAALKLVDQLLDLLALGVAVGRAGVLHHREREAPGGVTDQILPAVEQGADLGDLGAVQPGDGLEAGQAALEDQGHEEGLHCVVKVVPQCDLGDALLQEGAVEGATPHLGAHGAGVLLLAQIKNDVLDLTAEDGVGDVQLPAQLGNRSEVHPRPSICVSHVQSDGLHVKGLG